jgi:D-3-phosphoglycerate dehydrogenase
MGKFTVLVTARSFGSADTKAMDLLVANGCEVKKLRTGNSTELREDLEATIGTADAIIAGLEPYDASLLDRSNQLKVISRYGVGYDGVDVQSATKKNIKVTITPGANGNSVADLAVTLILSAARFVPYMDETLKAQKSVRPIGQEAWQKTLGVIGTGRIGQGVIARCAGFGMKVLCYDMYKNQEIQDTYGATYTTLENLIANSDFITIHTPLTAETENMFSTEQFKMMKSNAVLVNTARGGIIDEDALYEALKNHEIWAAGLDVTREGVPYTGKLCELPNCILTPHAGAATLEASSNMSLMAAQNALAVLEGKSCEFAVN